MNADAARHRLVLLMIVGVPVTIILAATWLWYYVASGRIDLIDVLGTANKGTLFDPPVSGVELDLRDAAGEPFRFDSERPLWRILVLGNGGCDQRCEDVVYYTRQIHTAMGKYANRIERGLLSVNGPGDALAESYPQLKLLYTSASGISALKAAVPGDSEAAYVVADPEGWIILSYAADADGKDIMADLKFLLKNSN